MQSRRLVVLLLLIGSLIGAMVTGRELFFNLAYAWAGLLGLSFLWAWTGVGGVRVTRHRRARHAQVGQPFDERFSVRNSSRLPKLWLEIRDASDLPGHYASRVVDGLGARSERAWTARSVCQERGRFRLGPLSITLGDPFGLFQMRRELPEVSHIVVYPYTVDLPTFPVPPGVLPGGEALRRRTYQITPNASGVREYAPGDSFNRIHWPSTARRDQLIVKEFELDPLADVWVFVDAQASVQHGEVPTAPDPAEAIEPLWRRTPRYSLPPTTEEYAVSIAASVAKYFIRQGRALGLAAYGHTREVVPADRGERQLTKILEVMAVLRADGRVPFDEVLQLQGDQLPRGSTAVLVTPSVDRDWALVAQTMQRRGLRVVAALIDPASFGGPGGMEVLAHGLTAQRVAVKLVRCGDNLVAALAGGEAANGKRESSGTSL